MPPVLNSFRVDVGTLRPPQRMPDGRLRVDAHITRAGVFLYMNPDGSVRRELRSKAVVFDAKSMRTFEMLPVTNTHPFEPVTPMNGRQHMVGANDSNVVRDGIHVRTEIMVIDAATIAAMESGELVEVSCGYTCDYDPTPGVDPEFGAYDGMQLNPVGNHIALVRHGRAGTARVRMDALASRLSADAAMMLPEGSVFTSIVGGHQHSVSPSYCDGPGDICSTSFSRAKGTAEPHRHEWTFTADGKVYVSMVDGHTHDVAVEWKVAPTPTPGDASQPAASTYDESYRKRRGDAAAALLAFDPRSLTPTEARAARSRVLTDAHRCDVDVSAFRERWYVASNGAVVDTNNGKVERVAARVDSPTAPRPPIQTSIRHAKEIVMPPEKKNEKTELQTATELLATAQQRVDAAEAREATLKKELLAANERADSAEGALEGLRKKLSLADEYKLDRPKLDEANAAILVLTKKHDALVLELDAVASPEERAKWVNERVDVLRRAEPHLPKVAPDVLARMDSLDIMLQVCERLGQAIPKDKADKPAYVAALFQERTDSHVACERAIAQVRIAAMPEAPRRSDTVDDARREMQERNSNRWKGETAAK